MHHRDEGIRGGFGADAHSGKILFQQVAVEEIRGTRDEMFYKHPVGINRARKGPTCSDSTSDNEKKVLPNDVQ